MTFRTLSPSRHPFSQRIDSELNYEATFFTTYLYSAYAPFYVEETEDEEEAQQHEQHH